MAIDLSPNGVFRTAKPLFRPWFLLAVIWWAYISWGYWGYLIPAFDPEPSGFDGGAAYSSAKSYGFTLPPDYGSRAYDDRQERIASYVRRQHLYDKALNFTLPFTIPIALWVLTFGAVTLGRWLADGMKQGGD